MAVFSYRTFSGFLAADGSVLDQDGDLAFLSVEDAISELDYEVEVLEFYGE